MADTPLDPMAGYDPNRAVQLPPPKPPQPASYEFDPQKEITPLGGRFFDDVENDTRLSRAEKTRIQTEYLNGMDDIQAQRKKIENERLRSLIDRQTLERNDMALAEARKKQGEVIRQAEVQKSAAGTVKEIISSNLPADEKRRQIGMFKIENAAAITTDPSFRTIVDTAESLIPVPAAPLYSTQDMKSKLEKGIPPEVVMRGNPQEIGLYERIIDTQGKEQSDSLSERKAAVKEYRSTILDLAKELPSFMTEEEAKLAGVNVNSPEEGGDPNALKYLNPESHQKGRILIGLLKGSAGLAEFEKLSDADKRDAIMVAQRDAMFQALQKADTISDTSEEDVTVDSLLAPKKR